MASANENKGAIKVREASYSESINEALRLEMRRDPDIFVAGEDVGNSGGGAGVLTGLLDEFGEKRVRGTPISEQAIIGLAIGASICGLRPVVEIMYSDFLGICMDQILNQAAKNKYMFGGKARLPMVIRTDYGAGFRAAAQHSQSLEAFFVHIPGLKVAMPSTPADAKGLLTTSIRDDNPVLFLEHKGMYSWKGEVPEGEYLLPFGQADIKRKGRDLTIVATGKMVHKSLEAATALAEKGIEIEVIDPRTLTPLDTATILESVRKTRRALIVQEAVKFGGFGSEIAATIAEEAFGDLLAPVRRIGAPYAPVPFSPVLEDIYVPSTAKIQQAAEELVGL
jgi:acetoin:2,6-dichlorophenolindophenol oxidoreductase subunit beta